MNRLFDEMSWPAPCKEMNELVHDLVHSNNLKYINRLRAASIIEAYIELILCSNDKRNHVISELRKGPNDKQQQKQLLIDRLKSWERIVETGYPKKQVKVAPRMVAVLKKMIEANNEHT